MIEESAYDELDRYVNGKMRGEELDGYTQKLDSDNALRSEVEWIKSTMIAMSSSGRSVMKQHIATSMSGEIEQYTPAKNKKSFWRKWWWACVLFVVGAAVAVVVVKYLPQGEGEGDNHGKDEIPLGGGTEGAVLMSDSAFVADSCAKVDSIMLHMENDGTVKDTVIVGFGLYGEAEQPDIYYDIDSVGKVVPMLIANTYNVGRVAWGSGSGNDIAMPVTLNIRKSPPFTYVLDSVLTLNSDYMCTKKMRFRGSGDTVIMTDSVNNTYVLLRNRGKLPLVKNNTLCGD